MWWRTSPHLGRSGQGTGLLPHFTPTTPRRDMTGLQGAGGAEEHTCHRSLTATFSSLPFLFFLQTFKKNKTTRHHYHHLVHLCTHAHLTFATAHCGCLPLHVHSRSHTLPAHTSPPHTVLTTISHCHLVPNTTACTGWPLVEKRAEGGEGRGRGGGGKEREEERGKKKEEAGMERTPASGKRKNITPVTGQRRKRGREEERGREGRRRDTLRAAWLSPGGRGARRRHCLPTFYLPTAFPACALFSTGARAAHLREHWFSPPLSGIFVCYRLDGITSIFAYGVTPYGFNELAGGVNARGETCHGRALRAAGQPGLC